MPAKANAIQGIYAKNAVIWVLIGSSMRPPRPPVVSLSGMIRFVASDTFSP